MHHRPASPPSAPKRCKSDYLLKPFALRELVARVRALGRRGPAMRAYRVTIDSLSLDFDTLRASSTDTEVPITRREWLTPLALAIGAGSEMQQPLAIAVIGGLSLSAVSSMVVLPALAAGLERFRPRVVSG